MSINYFKVMGRKTNTILRVNAILGVIAFPGTHLNVKYFKR